MPTTPAPIRPPVKPRGPATPPKRPTARRLLLRVWHSVVLVATAALALPLTAVAAVLDALCDWNLLWGGVAVTAFAFRDRLADPVCDRIEVRLARLADLGYRPPLLLRPLVDESKIPRSDKQASITDR